MIVGVDVDAEGRGSLAELKGGVGGEEEAGEEVEGEDEDEEEEEDEVEEEANGVEAAGVLADFEVICCRLVIACTKMMSESSKEYGVSE